MAQASRAMLLAAAFLFLFTQGIAARGAINGDVFVVSAIGGVIVGLGASLGSGCTSGHGVCGMTRFSPRSTRPPPIRLQ